MKSVANLSGWMKYLLIAFVVISFAINNAASYMPTISAANVFLAILMMLAYGIFYWLVFEVLVGFLYSGLKAKIEKNLTLNQFMNIFRFVIIPTNLISYLTAKLLMLINFYFAFANLLISILIMFGMLMLALWIINKNFFENKLDKEVIKTYFSFVFVYLCVHSFMWGVM